MIYVFPPELGIFLFVGFALFLLAVGVKKLGSLGSSADRISHIKYKKNRNAAGTVWVKDVIYHWGKEYYEALIADKSGKEEWIWSSDWHELCRMIKQRFETTD